ncbi:MAG: hypothetical protein AB7G06_04330 [Bdellovibrionales bacterium]
MFRPLKVLALSAATLAASSAAQLQGFSPLPVDPDAPAYTEQGLTFDAAPFHDLLSRSPLLLADFEDAIVSQQENRYTAGLDVDEQARIFLGDMALGPRDADHFQSYYEMSVEDALRLEQLVTSRVFNVNCYAFAVDSDLSGNHRYTNEPGFQNGDFRSAVLYRLGIRERPSDIIQSARSDGLIFLGSEVSPHKVQADGRRLVALLYDEAAGYHWVVQTHDGRWAHKAGIMDPTMEDSNGEVIRDPRTAAFRYGSSNYRFVGFFAAPDVDLNLPQELLEPGINDAIAQRPTGFFQDLQDTLRLLI